MPVRHLVVRSCPDANNGEDLQRPPGPQLPSPYSALSASAGLLRVARQAGSAAATPATKSITTATPPNVTGSAGFTWESMEPRRRVPNQAPTPPTTSPITARRIAPATTEPGTEYSGAVRAILSPGSDG